MQRAALHLYYAVWIKLYEHTEMQERIFEEVHCNSFSDIYITKLVL